MMKDQNAKMVLDMILTYCTARDIPSLEKLVQVLPPGVIPLDWIMEYGQPMDPRFYSIASQMQFNKFPFHSKVGTL